MEFSCCISCSKLRRSSFLAPSPPHQPQDLSFLRAQNCCNLKTRYADSVKIVCMEASCESTGAQALLPLRSKTLYTASPHQHQGRALCRFDQDTWRLERGSAIFRGRYIEYFDSVAPRDCLLLKSSTCITARTRRRL